MKPKSILSLSLVAASLVAGGQQSAFPATKSDTAPSVSSSGKAQPTLQNRAPRYKVRRGDSFELQFAFSPELNQMVSVQPDGYITLKSAGTLNAEGQTIPELTIAIEHAYAGILHDPVVTIDLKDFEKPYFVVTGQVGKPGKYELRSDLTVVEGVAIAGGFTEMSKHSQVVLFHPGDNGITEARLVNLKKMLNSRNLTEDLQLHSGDMIYVPKNAISKIQRYLPTTNLGMYGYPFSF